MKIPFIKYHIVKTQVLLEKEKLDRELGETCEQFYAIRSLASGVIPEMEQLAFAINQAKVGSSAYGRRKARRKVVQMAEKLKVAMEAA